MSNLEQNLDILMGKYVIFPYGTNRFKGKKVEKETKKKFEFDLWKNSHLENMSRPEMIMKNTIIHITDDKDEAIEVLTKLNAKADEWRKIDEEMRDMVYQYRKGVNHD